MTLTNLFGEHAYITYIKWSMIRWLYWFDHEKSLKNQTSEVDFERLRLTLIFMLARPECINARQWSRGKQTSLKYIIFQQSTAFNHPNRAYQKIIYIAVWLHKHIYCSSPFTSPLKIPPRYTDFAPQPTQPQSHIRNILLQSCTDHLNLLHLWDFLLFSSLSAWDLDVRLVPGHRTT